MIGCLRTRVRKQPIIALYSEFETVLKCYNLGAGAFIACDKYQNLMNWLKSFSYFYICN